MVRTLASGLGVLSTALLTSGRPGRGEPGQPDDLGKRFALFVAAHRRVVALHLLGEASADDLFTD
jgi:hypothetical protein